MTFQTQYVIPIVKESEKTWTKIHMLTQPLTCLYDQTGHLNGCYFSSINNEWLGEFYLFQSLDKKVAEIVRKTFLKDKDLNVLPLRKVRVSIK